jgi:16S rRNA (adenine1518-N6/adenine1519-N6)-dimethyltransferase
LIAVEIDLELAKALTERYKDQPHVTVANEDVLTLQPDALLGSGDATPLYVIVGNLPYNVGTAIVSHFLQSESPPRWLLVTLQAEVAESMCGSPGKMSYLSVLTGLYATARILFYVPARAFRPPPKVRSAVVRIDVRDQPLVTRDDCPHFIKVAQAGFAAPRKRIRNSLAIGLRITASEAEDLLARAAIDPTIRPAELTLTDWVGLHDAAKTR